MTTLVHTLVKTGDGKVLRLRLPGIPRVCDTVVIPYESETLRLRVFAVEWTDCDEEVLLRCESER